MYGCMHIAHVCMYVCTCMYVHVCMYVCMYMYMYVSTCTCTFRYNYGDMDGSLIKTKLHWHPHAVADLCFSTDGKYLMILHIIYLSMSKPIYLCSHPYIIYMYLYLSIFSSIYHLHVYLCPHPYIMYIHVFILNIYLYSHPYIIYMSIYVLIHISSHVFISIYVLIHLFTYMFHRVKHQTLIFLHSSLIFSSRYLPLIRRRRISFSPLATSY